jgi:dTDP-4-amino-4,6-dideoxygalactose transaminase
MESLMTEVLTSEANSAEPVPFIDLKAQYQTIRDEIDQAVHRVFESQGFILGDEVSGFETETARYCDSLAAVGCASGSDALLLALLGLDLGPGDEVITSPFTFFATAGAICRAGATPIFADILPDTFNIDPQAIENAVTPKTRALMPVHLFGQCADMDPIWRTATQHGVTIIEDACQAIGATYHGRMAGVLGRVGCFSCFPTKNLGAAGDAGFITTDDRELASRMARLRVHGDSGGYSHHEVGFNSRLDSLQAAVLRVKLAFLDEWSDARRENAAHYRGLFSQYELEDVITLPQEVPELRHIYNQFSVRVHDNRRDEVLQSLRADQIGCTIYYPQPLHLQACFAGLGGQAGQFPESEKAAAEVLALPIYAELPLSHQERVVHGIAVALGREKATGPVTYSFDMPDSRAA